MEIYRDGIDQNRIKINQRLHETIRKTENAVFAIFYDSLRDEKFLRAQNLLEQLKTDDVNKVHTKLLELLRDFFEKNFYDITSNPNLGGLYFNEPLKDLYWFDFIFDYVDTSYSKIEKSDWSENEHIKRTENKEKNEDKDKKNKIFLASDHRLLQESTYKEMRKDLLEGVDKSLNYYTSKFIVDKNNKGSLKYFIEKYILYIIKDALLEKKLVLNLSKSGNEILRVYIEDVIDYFQNKFDVQLEIDRKRLFKKFFSNTKTEENCILEYSYENTLSTDIQKREQYFTATYFLSYNLSAKDIYGQVMSEYSIQSGSIKSAHEFYSPDYFLFKNKKLRLESELYNLLAQSDYGNEYKEIIESIKNEIKELENKMKNHFYAKIEKSDFVGKGKSLKEIGEKYMKYYKIPIQYRNMFFILINYYNHYNKTKKNIRRNANEINEALEKQLFSASDVSGAINSYLHQYITFKKQDELFQQKRENSYQKKIENLQKKTYKDPKPKLDTPNNHQFTLDF